MHLGAGRGLGGVDSAQSAHQKARQRGVGGAWWARLWWRGCNDDFLDNGVEAFRQNSRGLAYRGAGSHLSSKRHFLLIVAVLLSVSSRHDKPTLLAMVSPSCALTNVDALDRLRRLSEPGDAFVPLIPQHERPERRIRVGSGLDAGCARGIRISTSGTFWTNDGWDRSEGNRTRLRRCAPLFACVSSFFHW